MLVASDDATAGSVIANADRIRPSSSGSSHSLALLLGAVAQQHLHVAGVGRVAVEDDRRDGRAPCQLGDGRVVDVREPLATVGAEPGGVLAGVLLREEEVPQPSRAGLGLEVLDDRERRPLRAGLAGGGQVAVVLRLDRLDLLGHEGPHPLGQLGGSGGRREVHAGQRSAELVRLFPHLSGVAAPDICRNTRISGYSSDSYAATVITTRARSAGFSHIRAARSRRKPDQATNGTVTSTDQRQSGTRASMEKARPVNVVDSASRVE